MLHLKTTDTRTLKGITLTRLVNLRMEIFLEQLEVGIRLYLLSTNMQQAVVLKEIAKE